MQISEISCNNVRNEVVSDMLTAQRKRHILERLERDGQIIAKSISDDLGVSEDTIRRDLRELAAEGRLLRVHGGALPASPATADFAARLGVAADEKRSIGRAAAAMVQPGQTVVLDGGTTAVQIARHFPSDLRATVITHSPTIAVELVAHPRIEVVLIGGTLFKHSVVAVGSAAVEAIRGIRADTYFMGVTGIHAQIGLTTGDYEEAHVKRALSQSAAETVVLASSEKLNTASPYLVTSLDTIAGMIVAEKASGRLLKPFRGKRFKITIASE